MKISAKYVTNTDKIKQTPKFTGNTDHRVTGASTCVSEITTTDNC